MRFARKYWAAGVGTLFACAAFSACSYDFDGLVAHTGAAGTAGIGGSGGSAGEDGSSGAAGSDDGGGTGGAGTDGSAGSAGAAGRGGAGTGGAAGKGGTGGTGGNAGTDAGTIDAGKGGNAGTADAGKGGNAGTADAASDRGPDAVVDVRSEPAFDCTAVSGTVYQSHCYYPSAATTTWDVANTTSCAPPSHLAVITTAGEQGAVAAILPGKDRWIGMRKDAGSPNMKSSLYWVTKEPLSFEIWDSYDTGAPEPNFTGDCVRMSPTDKWGDTGCNTAYAAVCEHE